MKHRGIFADNHTGKLSVKPSCHSYPRNLCRACQANQHEFFPLELHLKLLKCVKRRRVSSAPLQRSHAVINGSGF
ncbi:hypothetical protein LDENG_00158700 [Lucifuga dentata]|nr:hypothetical protein LDENG_00158700 [Lucifuga dentata]